MKILYASTVFPHARDQTRGTYNRELVAGLQALGHDVRVVAPVPWRQSRGSSPSPDDPPNLPIARPTYWYLPRLAPRHLGTRLFAAMRRGVRQIARGWTPDLLISYWLYPDGWAAQKLARDVGAPHVTIVGGSDVLQLPHEARRGPLARSVLRDCDLALAVSQQLVDAIGQLDSTTAARQWSQGIRTSVLHDGDQAEARRELNWDRILPHWPSDEPVFVWVGRMVGVKALPRLLEATQLAGQSSPLRLVVVGDGESHESTVELARSMGLGDRVHFAGARPPRELGHWYRAGDAVVLSSDSEGLPNVLREALACGRPFASTHVGGIAEIGDESCRVLAPPGDAVALAEAMRTVLQPSYRKGAAAYPVHSWVDAASELLSAVETRDAVSA